MEQKHLVEKLAFQAESFHEGFEILTQSNNFEEMVRNFEHLSRSNFLITSIQIYHKESSEAQWKSIGLENKFDESDLSYLINKNQLSINYFEKQKFNCSVVLPLSDSSYLGILLGSKLDGTDLNDFDKITLQILLQVLDGAHKYHINQKKVKKLIFELNEKVSQLNNLIDTGIELSKYEKQSVLYEFALERASSLTNASSALINIVDKGGSISEQQYTFPVKTPAESILDSNFKIESSFEHNNKHYQFVLCGKETRSGTTSFNELDKSLLQAISRQVHASIENQYLYEQSLVKERMEKELSVAALIQQRVIPEELPNIDGYELAGTNIPSREVGGDYYDCISLGNGKYALIIADVAGKGIAAALLVNTLNAALHSYMEFNLPLIELADKLNKLIFESSPPDKFITFFIAILDSKTGECDILNAGHNPILLLRKNGTLEQFNAGGIGLGMLDFGVPYSGENLIVNSGDKLFLYTDGIPEAMNFNEEEYSDERMIEFFKKHSDFTSEKFINAIVDDVAKFVGNAYQSDDITSLILKRI